MYINAHYYICGIRGGSYEGSVGIKYLNNSITLFQIITGVTHLLICILTHEWKYL